MSESAIAEKLNKQIKYHPFPAKLYAYVVSSLGQIERDGDFTRAKFATSPQGPMYTGVDNILESEVVGQDLDLDRITSALRKGGKRRGTRRNKTKKVGKRKSYSRRH